MADRVDPVGLKPKCACCAILSTGMTVQTDCHTALQETVGRTHPGSTVQVT